jgi:uncharacterized protein (DUF2141 family)
MKTLLLISINLCFTLLSFAQQGTLEVKIEKNNTLEGEIYVGVFTEKGFLMQPLKTGHAELKDKIATTLIEDLEYGTYAISAYQDVNGNNRLDMDEYGRPTEPWVMSGSPSSMMPVWSEAKFKFNSEKKKVKLKI